jgi:hypothetical protein
LEVVACEKAVVPINIRKNVNSKIFFIVKLV